MGQKEEKEPKNEELSEETTEISIRMDKVTANIVETKDISIDNQGSKNIKETVTINENDDLYEEIKDSKEQDNSEHAETLYAVDDIRKEEDSRTTVVGIRGVKQLL